jgi:hypothetical protein
MNSEILTINATDTLTYANKLAAKRNQKVIKGDDIFFATYMVAKSKNLSEIFCHTL